MMVMVMCRSCADHDGDDGDDDVQIMSMSQHGGPETKGSCLRTRTFDCLLHSFCPSAFFPFCILSVHFCPSAFFPFCILSVQGAWAREQQALQMRAWTYLCVCVCVCVSAFMIINTYT